MRRLVVLGVLLAAGASGACGGVQVPQHNGYKTANAKPWKKPKQLKWDAKMEAKAEGDLSYPDMRRAAWFAIDTPSVGTLDLRLEITPPGDATNDDFDLGLEVFDPGYKSLARSDLEESDAHELNKKQTLVELPPAKYLVHLYLQGRLDTAEYALHVAFHPTAPSAQKSDFPAQVAFMPILPMVPLDDDTPKGQIKPPPPPPPRGPHHPPPPPPPKDPPKAALSGRIIGMNVVGANVQITIGRNTSNGGTPTMVGKIAGISEPVSVTCNEKACIGLVKASADQVRSASTITLIPQ